MTGREVIAKYLTQKEEDEALKNMDERKHQLLYENNYRQPHYFIDEAFTWCESEEGEYYWDNIYCRMYDGVIMRKQLKPNKRLKTHKIV